MRRMARCLVVVRRHVQLDLAPSNFKVMAADLGSAHPFSISSRLIRRTRERSENLRRRYLGWKGRHGYAIASNRMFVLSAKAQHRRLTRIIPYVTRRICYSGHGA
jgi:hypothetical protein